MIVISSLKALVRRRLDPIRTRCLETSRHRRELNDSSDRALAEIGMARGDISAVVKGQFGRA